MCVPSAVCFPNVRVHMSPQLSHVFVTQSGVAHASGIITPGPTERYIMLNTRANNLAPYLCKYCQIHCGITGTEFVSNGPTSPSYTHNVSTHKQAIKQPVSLHLRTSNTQHKLDNCMKVHVSSYQALLAPGCTAAVFWIMTKTPCRTAPLHSGGSNADTSFSGSPEWHARSASSTQRFTLTGAVFKCFTSHALAATASSSSSFWRLHIRDT